MNNLVKAVGSHSSSDSLIKIAQSEKEAALTSGYAEDRQRVADSLLSSETKDKLKKAIATGKNSILLDLKPHSYREFEHPANIHWNHCGGVSDEVLKELNDALKGHPLLKRARFHEFASTTTKSSIRSGLFLGASVVGLLAMFPASLLAPSPVMTIPIALAFSTIGAVIGAPISLSLNRDYISRHTSFNKLEIDIDQNSNQFSITDTLQKLFRKTADPSEKVLSQQQPRASNRFNEAAERISTAAEKFLNATNNHTPPFELKVDSFKRFIERQVELIESRPSACTTLKEKSCVIAMEEIAQAMELQVNNISPASETIRKICDSFNLLTDSVERNVKEEESKIMLRAVLGVDISLQRIL